MSIVETMARAYCAAYGSDPNEWWESHSREIAAALRAIKPEDVSGGMVQTLSVALMRAKARGDITDDDLRRAIAAAIAAGAGE